MQANYRKRERDLFVNPDLDEKFSSNIDTGKCTEDQLLFFLFRSNSECLYKNHVCIILPNIFKECMKFMHEVLSRPFS